MPSGQYIDEKAQFLKQAPYEKAVLREFSAAKITGGFAGIFGACAIVATERACSGARR